MASKEEKPKIVKKAVVKGKVVKKPAIKAVKPNYKSLSIKAIELIRYEGISMIDACNRVKINRKYFYEQLDECIELRNKYTRACEIRCDMMAEDIIKIAGSDILFTEEKEGVDDIKGSWNEKIIKDNASKRKDMIDARKWLLSKMMPKKYGTVKEDKEEINIVVQPILQNNPLTNDTTDNSTEED